MKQIALAILLALASFGASAAEHERFLRADLQLDGETDYVEVRINGVLRTDCVDDCIKNNRVFYEVTTEVMAGVQFSVSASACNNASQCFTDPLEDVLVKPIPVDSPKRLIIQIVDAP